MNPSDATNPTPAQLLELARDPINLFVLVSGLAMIVAFLVAFTQVRFWGLILRNVWRNKARAALTIGSTVVCMGLMMLLLAFITVQNASVSSLKAYNRIVSMSSQGFGQMVPIKYVADIENEFAESIVAATPYSWYGGKLGEEQLPFAQFAVDPAKFVQIYTEYEIPEDQKQAWLNDPAGCLIGYKIAEDRGYKIGDTIPLVSDIYEFPVELTIRAFYRAPAATSQRICFFHWSYLEEGLKTKADGRNAGNAGVVVIKCREAREMPELSARIDGLNASSQYPTRTQTEEAFAAQFAEFLGDLPTIIRNIGMAVVFVLICVAGNTMAMAIRERVVELSVMRAIGFARRQVFLFVLIESLALTLIGGAIGAIGTKLWLDWFDVAKYAGGFLAAFYVTWPTALTGLAVAFWVGLLSGVPAAARAATIPVVSGLRKVV